MTPITQTEAYLVKLRNLVEPEDILEKHGYTIRLLTDEELLLKRRCSGCGKTMSQCVPKRSNRSRRSLLTNGAEEPAETIVPSAQLSNVAPPLSTGLSVDEELALATPGLRDLSITEHAQAPSFRCQYHPGQVSQKYWTCCSQHVTAKPCGGSNTHDPRPYAPGELNELYQFHLTPHMSSRGGNFRAAVALDCEMGTAVSGDSELIKVTLIDYFSGAMLVNNFVEPDVPMRELNTRFSGVSWSDINNAKRKGIALKGKAGARRALWRYIRPETVVVGHGASNDLRALRWIHGLVVDSFVTEFGTMKRKEAENAHKKEDEAEKVNVGESRATDPTKGDTVPRKDVNGGASAVHVSGNGNETATNMQKKSKRSSPGYLSLKNLVKQRLGRNIQMGGRAGHDSLEDAIAARDLTHWIVTKANQE